jgi:hypothetical protein
MPIKSIRSNSVRRKLSDTQPNSSSSKTPRMTPFPMNNSSNLPMSNSKQIFPMMMIRITSNTNINYGKLDNLKELEEIAKKEEN